MKRYFTLVTLLFVLFGSIHAQQIDEAARLNALLASLDELLLKLENLDSRLSVLEGQLGLEPSDGSVPTLNNGHEYVDLGMVIDGKKVVWATCNIGAETPEDSGFYFAWGETEGYTDSDGHHFDWRNYKFMQPDKTDWKYINKYTFDDGQTSASWYRLGSFIGDGKTVLDLEDDAAHENWQGDWRMPTYDELNWLSNTANCTWTEDDEGRGYNVSSKLTGESIFLPSTGFQEGHFGVQGERSLLYWSSSLSTSNSNSAYQFQIIKSPEQGIFYRMKADFRNIGIPVRPVCVLTDGQYQNETKIITLDQASIQVSIGQSWTLSATVTPSNVSDKTLSWSSSNLEVATVNDGVVQGIAKGTATIIVTANDGSGVTSNCLVEVVERNDSSNGHNYVDLGLKDSQGRTIYWATCNVGAESPERRGLYYAWGDTKGDDFRNGFSGFSWSDAPFNNGRSSFDATYFSTVKDEVCPDGELAPKYDVAHVNWGGDWRMPSRAELDALRTQCIWTWDYIKGVYIIKGTNGNTIILPITDIPLLTSGTYWSLSLDTNDLSRAYSLMVIKNGQRKESSINRCYKNTVRPVCVFSDISVSSIALSQTSVQITKGNSVILTATVSPTNATDKTLIWSSSNPAVATVEGGVVRGIAEGFATITVEANDGSGVKTTCSVEVVAGTGVTGSSNGHDYVDLGMKDSQGHTVYWATCNIGAETPEDYGLYFAWGDTEGHSSNGTNGTQPDGYYYNWANMPFNNGSSDYDKTYFDSVKDEVCPGGVLAPEYDAAHVNWQGDWRMPTSGELYWLRKSDNCTWTWDSTKKGYTVTSKTTGASIFLPSAGSRNDSDLFSAGSFGGYWSSSLDSDYSLNACCLYFYLSDRGMSYDYRYCGRSVRPVCVFSE